MRPLVDLVRFPDTEVQLTASVAVNCIVLGLEQGTKASVMTEDGLEPILKLIRDNPSHISTTKTLSSSSATAALASKTSSSSSSSSTNDRYYDEKNDQVNRSAIYALGSLAENEEVKSRLVELGALEKVVPQLINGDIDIKRTVGMYMCICVCICVLYRLCFFIIIYR
jgi:hypothetical protein